mgnify:CR=1 FL=1
MIILLVIFTIISKDSITQVVNMNPDPNGPPWWSGGVSQPDSATLARIHEIPFIYQRSFSTLPSIVDNSLKKYMRPVFRQLHGSCAQASGVGYIFTYEINWLKNTSANDSSRLYPTHFTYNFLNDGSGSNGSHIVDGWDIIMQSGCPNIKEYGGMSSDFSDTRWMTGYEKYYKALQNKIDSIFKINFRNPEDGLEILKQWIFNHNNDTLSSGGLASFTTNMFACRIGIIPPGTPEEGAPIVYHWLNPFGDDHQLTVVGFNDSVRYDFNGDYLYTNDVDVNNDGYINMKDWEIGALKIYNSWGTNWPGVNDSGYVYWPYRLLADSMSIRDSDTCMYLCSVKESPPKLTIQIQIEDTNRNSLHILADKGLDALTDPPIAPSIDYKMVCYNGGHLPMIGDGSFDPIEIELDYACFIDNLDSLGKLFLDVLQAPPRFFEGYLNELALVDYRWNEVFKLKSNYTNDSITFRHNWFSLEYDLIVPGDNQRITQDDTLYSNMVSRFNPTVSNNSTLTISNGVKIDMYNSSIIVNEGSSLIIGDSVVITGKRGTNKLIIDGNITLGSNVVFDGIDEIRLNNDSLQTTFIQTTFKDTTILINYGEELIVDYSSFEDCFMAYSYNGDVSINNTSFVNTGLYLKNPVDQQESFQVVIDGCDFMNSTFNTISAIEIRSFDEFFVEDNEITGFDAGTQKAIEVWYSGDGEAGNQLISGNTIYGNETGLLVYSSIASVEKNNFNDNDYGVKFEGTSNVSLLGDSTETQYIKDNTYYEVYASSESFPVYFHYNEIVDSDNGGNPTDPLVYHNDTDTLTKRDVRYNCWRSGFSPNDDLYPAGDYLYLPEYCSSKKSAPETGPDEVMYNNAVEDFEAGNYDSSKATYMSLVEQYNGSPFSKAALKDLFSLEYFATNDYEELKNYYRTNDSIQADTSLSKLGDIMANKCDMELENWQTAIDWYEDVILNPETYEDSIYAVIDLGYLYLQIDSSTLKSTNGNFQEYIPGSWEKFDEKSAYLLSLLPGDKKKHVENKNLPKGKVGVLFQNVPNPFNNSTLVEFHLLEEGTVALEVYDYTGKKLNTIKLGLLEQGRHSKTLYCTDLAPGVYFYSLVVNGRLADSRKMSVQ